MQIQHAILLPPAVLALLTAVVFGRLYSDRIAEIRARRIHPQQLATSKQSADTLQNVTASDNYRNLFEAPVLFYALCGYLAITQLTTMLLLACAWGYVFLRTAHTFVHLTSNKVIRRFQLFFASSIVLFAMWLLFLIRLLTA
jgi:hypothetical protein